MQPIAGQQVIGGRLRAPRRVGGRRVDALREILSVCPAAVALVARALHIRMPMQNGGNRDSFQDARVRLQLIGIL